MRRKLVAGNWKMNGDTASIISLIQQLKIGLANFLSVDIAVFPSFTYLPLVQTLLKESQISVGAQCMSQWDEGAYTGEVSGKMLTDIGCHYVLAGHSERRQFFGETDEVVAKKFEAALRYHLTPILCVGETQTERESNQTEAVVLRQLEAVIQLTGVESFRQAVIAYEPVWAIGTGLTATPEQAQTVHAYIRSVLDKLNPDVAKKVQILYGGSVKASNAREIFAKSDVDGGLIGGASLKAEEFIKICQS